MPGSLTPHVKLLLALEITSDRIAFQELREWLAKLRWEPPMRAPRIRDLAQLRQLLGEDGPAPEQEQELALGPDAMREVAQGFADSTGMKVWVP